jgi:hypothetical protein
LTKDSDWGARFPRSNRCYLAFRADRVTNANGLARLLLAFFLAFDESYALIFLRTR